MVHNHNRPMIEGIGDEVVEFFASLIIILLVIAAWRLTRVREFPSADIILFSQWLQIRLFEVNMQRALMHRLSNILDSVQAEANTASENSSNTAESSTTAGQNGEGTFPKQNVSTVDPASVEAGAEVAELPSHSPRQSDTVRIKVQFLNSSIKTYDCNLDEKLGDFKRRNFSQELSRGNIVMFIFNGGSLSDDDRTLGDCGLFNDCVVHCVIREPPSELRPRARPRDRLSEKLLAFFGALIVGVWYSRIRYTEMFTASATAGLIILSAMYTTFLIICFPPPRWQNLVYRVRQG